MPPKLFVCTAAIEKQDKIIQKARIVLWKFKNEFYGRMPAPLEEDLENVLKEIKDFEE